MLSNGVRWKPILLKSALLGSRMQNVTRQEDTPFFGVNYKMVLTAQHANKTSVSAFVV